MAGLPDIEHVLRFTLVYTSHSCHVLGLGMVVFLTAEVCKPPNSENDL